MKRESLSHWMRGRAFAAATCATLVLPLAGEASATSLPPTRAAFAVAPAATTVATAGLHQMTTRKKVVLLVGAAALYYLYRKHKAASAQNAGNPQANTIYYLSKNGRVYYRDASHRAHWVTPPTAPIAVSPDEAQSYRGLQGYDQSATGETNLSRFAARGGY